MTIPLRTLTALSLAAGLLISGARAQSFLDKTDEVLSVSTSNGLLRARLSGLADFEYYSFDQPAPGLLQTPHDDLLAPRLSLFLDAQIGPAIYAFAQARLDSGFDPSDDGAQVRLDEWAVRFTPWEDGRLSVQAGQFATVIGNWTKRHNSWDNAFVTAPLAYEQLTNISDLEAPEDADEFVEDFGQATSYEYSPLIWGPVYATGVSVSGRVDKLEYALELKNRGPSSRPEAWSITETGFSHPTIAGRVAYHPDLQWTHGISFSRGPYLNEQASADVPAGHGVGDYQQYVLGIDSSFEWRHLQIWGEAYAVRYQVPRFGNADALSYFIEAKYKFAVQWYGALRWNQQWYSTLDVDGFGNESWSRDINRMDAALAFRPTEHLQLKLQYSLGKEQGPNSWIHLFAAQCTLRF